MGDLDNVNVALRIRPLVQSEMDRGCQVSVEKVPNENQVVVSNSGAFTFNYVFDWNNTQEEIYDATVSPIIDKFIGGFNATILAYGQTGSGKTHTMGTTFDGNLDNDQVGVIPRAMRDIFERLENMSEHYEFVVKCSFMELYQEQLYDLLSEKNREESVVDIREDRSGIVIAGITEHLVCNAKETTDCLLRGSSGRAVGATAMNEQSSRSHAIFTITLQFTKKDESRATTKSKFHLVDLAGSERSKKTQATGDRFKEGVKINQGLLALGNVISALGDGKGAGFVRYRDSKLTRLLQDSLGGNSVTLMIACVSPADYNVAETLSTLRYADRARKIKNKPIINQDSQAAEVNRLKSTIQKLRLLLLSNGISSSSLNSDMEYIEPMSQFKTMTSSLPASITNNNNNEVNRKYKELQHKYSNLQQQLQETLHDVVQNEMRAHIAEKAHEQIKAKSSELKIIIENMTDCLSKEELQNKLKQINELVLIMNDELERTTMEILDDKKCFPFALMQSNDNDGVEGRDNNIPEVNFVVQERTEAFTSKQVETNEQLRRINQEITLKEELQQLMTCNWNSIINEERFKKFQEKVNELEAEKSELLEKLRCVKENASAKIAEQRRKRLQALENEITVMKTKILNQSQMLKVRERHTLKMKNLNQEVQAMKEMKVKLIRSMRQEAEKFRQFRLVREKELVQLRNKDRKLQNEMARKEALHSKQRNVLKRKCEEAMAINKRLKDALDRQKIAQTQRLRMQSAKGSSKLDQIIGIVEHEVEVIISLIDAGHTLEQLMDDRGVISTRIKELEQQQSQDKNFPDTHKLNNLREELEMRKAQIADLQQKVYANDLDIITANVVDMPNNLVESRAIIKHLLKSISELRQEHTKVHTQALDNLNVLREKYEECKKKIHIMKLEHDKEIAEYEEKISVVLTPEEEDRMALLEEQEHKIKILENELLELKESSNFYNKRRKTKNSNNQQKIEGESLTFSTSDSEGIDEDYSKDPDWYKTPLVKRSRKKLRKSSTSSRQSTQGKSEILETTSGVICKNEDSNGSELQQSTEHETVSSESFRNVEYSINKKKSKGSRCKCQGNCLNKRCGCNSCNRKCSLKCYCTSKCKNRDTYNIKEIDNENESSKDDKIQITDVDSVSTKSDEENTSKQNTLNVTKPILSNSSTYLTPKIARLSTLNFERSASRKKFFE